MNITKSKIWTLIPWDFVKGLVVAVLTSVLTIVYQMLQQQVEIDLKQVGIAGIIAGLAYLIKNISTTKDDSQLGGLIKSPADDKK